MKTCRKPLAHNSLLAPSLAAFTVLVVIGHALAAEPRESKTQPAGTARVQLPSPEELTALLSRLGYEEGLMLDNSVDGDDADPDIDPEPDLADSSIPPWSNDPRDAPDADFDPNRPTRPESWSRFVSLSPEKDAGKSDASSIGTVFGYLRQADSEDCSVIISVSGNARQSIARIAEAIAPQLAEPVRTAIEEHARTGKKTERTVGDVRIEIDKKKWFLRNLDPATAFLIRSLESDRGFHDAPSALAAIGEAAVPHLLQALKDATRHVRIRAGAAEALGLLPADLSQAALVEALRDEDGWVRDAAAEALGNQRDPANLPALVEAAKDVNSRQVVCAIGAIVERDPRFADEAVMEVLIRALGDSDSRASATHTLGRIGPRAKIALPALTKLKGATSYARIAIATAVSDISGEPDFLVEALIMVICERDLRVTSEVKLPLREMGNAAVPALRRLAKHKNELVRETAARELQIILSSQHPEEPASPNDD